MPIQNQWDNAQKTILRNIYEGEWDLEDLYMSQEAMAEKLDSVDHGVDVIVDLRESMSVPRSFLPHMRRMNDKAHPNTRRLILVGANPIMTALFNMARKIYRRNEERQISMCHTLEEAYRILDHKTLEAS